MSNILFNAFISEIAKKILISPHAKIYEFTISEYSDGNFSFSVYDLTDEISCFLVDANSDEVFIREVTDSSINEEILLQPGKYKIIIQPTKSVEKSVRYKLSSNLYICDVDFSGGSDSPERTVFKFSVDEYIKCDLNVEVINDTTRFRLYKTGEGEIKNFLTSDKYTLTELLVGEYTLTAQGYGLNGEAHTDFRIQCVYSRQPEEYEFDSPWDNLRESARIITLNEALYGYENWVGTADTDGFFTDSVDWVRVTEITYGSSFNITFNILSGSITVNLYNYDNERYSSLSVFTVTSSYTRKVTVKGDLIVKVTAKNNSVYYNFNLDAV